MELDTYYLDCETVGLHGVPVLIQHAVNDGPVNVVSTWNTPIADLMSLIEKIVDNRVVAHNLTFDHFQISKLYGMMIQVEDTSKCLCDFTKTELVEMEWQSQFGPCLKPRAAVDTFLLASQGENQSFLMDSKAVRVRRIPLGVAEPLCEELNKKTELPWILFGHKKDQTERWKVVENTDRKTGDPDPYFRDIQISFAPSKSLKDLAVFLCDHETPAKFKDIMCEAKPAEEGYAPFAKLLSSEDRGWLYNDKPTWPAVIEQHVEHWATNEDAQAYAEDDIHMLRKLYQFFGSPEDDRDSILACQVASVRLRGFAVNIDGVHKCLRDSNAIVAKAELNVNSPKQVLGYVAAALDEMEQVFLTGGCDQKVIDSIKQEFTLDEIEDCDCDGGLVSYLDESGQEATRDCLRCGGRGEVGPTGSCGECDGCGHTSKLDENGEPKKCKPCDGTGFSDDRKMPVVLRVEHIELIRKHTKRVELFHKLLLAKRAYPDFKVIGTKSGRMSGASGLNFQGIDSSTEVRSLFVLSDPGLVLSAGDYSSQELAIAATTMNDDELMKDMESGKSLHGLFAAQAYETTYEDIMSNKKDGRYGKAKGGVYAILYGGTFETVAKNMGIDVKVAEAAYNRMVANYPQMGETRRAVTERFSSMKQDSDGKIQYKDPPEKFIESVFGYRRYFNTEYALQKMILSVIQNMPQQWKDIEIKVERTEGKRQSMVGAICSALYGAAFSLQNKVIRASRNHVIQSTGRELTVGMQAHVWDLQPQGINPFLLTLMSIHDELAVVSGESEVAAIQSAIEDKVQEQCKTVPLTSIEWFTGNKSWAEKSHGEQGVVLGWKPRAETLL